MITNKTEVLINIRQDESDTKSVGWRRLNAANYQVTPDF